MEKSDWLKMFFEFCSTRHISNAFLIDLYPEDINVIGSKICSNNLHDSVHCHLIYKKISAHIYVNWAHPFKEHKFVIMGTKGSLVYDDIEKKYIIIKNILK